MILLRLIKFIIRLILGSTKAAFNELRGELNVDYPYFNSFKEQINYSLRVYFLPLTASWRGLKNEWKKGL